MTTPEAGAATDHPDPIALLSSTEASASVEPWMESTDPEPGLWPVPVSIRRIAQQTSIIWKG